MPSRFSALISFSHCSVLVPVHAIVQDALRLFGADAKARLPFCATSTSLAGSVKPGLPPAQMVAHQATCESGICIGSCVGDCAAGGRLRNSWHGILQLSM